MTREKLREKINKYIILDLDSIDDIFLRNEIQANRILALSLLNLTFLSVLTLLLGLFVFRNYTDTTKIVLASVSIDFLIASISSFIAKGRGKITKYLTNIWQQQA